MEVVGAAAGVAGLIGLAGQTIQGIIKLKTFFGDLSRSQTTILEFLYDIESLNHTLADVRSLLSKIQTQATISSSDGSVTTLEAYLVVCSTDIKEWIKIAEKIDPASRNRAEAIFKQFQVAVNKRGISDIGRRVTNHQQRIGTSISVLGRSLDVLTLESISVVNSKIDNVTKSHSESAATWAAKLGLIEEKVAEEVVRVGDLTPSLSVKLDRIETSSRVSMENSVHSSTSLDSVSSMVSQIYSTVSKWNSVISSGQHELPCAKSGSAPSSENAISAAVVATEEKKDGSAAYRCYFPCCYEREMPNLIHFRRHLALNHDDTEPELSSLLERLAPEDVQVWSCDALIGIEDAFDVDLCGYCGEEFHASPPDWNARGKHLVTKHCFGTCSTSTEQYSSLDFGEHLRHIHYATQESLTNTVFMRKFFTSESKGASGRSSKKGSQSASDYNDLPKEFAEVAALFQVQIRLLFDEFKQFGHSDDNDTTLFQGTPVKLQDDISTQLQTLQIDVARIQEQFVVDGHSFDALNLSWDLCSCMRTQDLRGTLNPRNDIDRMNLIDDIAGKDLLGKWKSTRDRINWWLLHMLRFSKTATTLIRGTLGIYDLSKSSEKDWICSVLEQWSIDEAGTHHEWPLMLSDGAVDSRDDPHLMFTSSTQHSEIQSVPNAIDSFLFKPKVPESPHSAETEVLRKTELAKTAIMAQFIKTSRLCNTAVVTDRFDPRMYDKAKKRGVRYLNQEEMERAEYMYPRALKGKEKAWGAEDTSTLDILNYLADLYRNKDKMKKAENIYLRAIEEYERTWGDHHISTLGTVQNLGILYSKQGKMKEAEDMYQRVLAGQEKTPDGGHILSIDAANNLGLLYSDQGKMKAAEDLYLLALAGYEEALGAEHTSTLGTVLHLGILYSKQGRMKEAEDMYQRVLAGQEKTPDGGHILSIDAANNLGLLYSDQGKIKAAEDLYLLALAGYVKALGAEHTSTLGTVLHLGILYSKQGRMKEAEDMYQRVLAGHEKTLDGGHILSIHAANNLGLLYSDHGRIKAAEDLYLRALAGAEKTWGAEDLSTLDTVNNLGFLYSNQGKVKEAEDMYLRALAGKEKTWGAEHLSTLVTVNNLATLYRNQGRMKEAEEMYLRALAAGEKTWGAKHLSTLVTVNNLATLYCNQGRIKEAEVMYVRALTGKEKTWGAELSTLITVNNLATLYRNQGRIKEAEVMYVRALAGIEKAQGREHTLTLAAINKLANLYRNYGRMKEAEDMYQLAMAGYEKARGAEHTYTLDAVNHLGFIYSCQGKVKEAEDLYLRALAGKEKKWGAENLSTLVTVNNLATLYCNQGRMKEAEVMYVRALAGIEKARGREHSLTLTAVNKLANLYRKQGRMEEAEDMYQLALARFGRKEGGEIDWKWDWGLV